MTVVYAHFGHWSTSLAFFAPVVVLPLGLWIVARRHPPIEPDDD